MIPLGVLASARRASAAPTVVQSKTALSDTLTLNSAPTPGNLLVLGIGNAINTPGSWTYSHTLTLDQFREQNGWYAGMASGLVLGGDSATVTVTGLNGGYPKRLIVWELSGVTAYSTGQVAGAASTTSLSPSSIATGSIALCVTMHGANVGTQSATGMTSDWVDNRFFAGRAMSPSLPFSTTVSWDTARDTACVLGGYA